MGRAVPPIVVVAAVVCSFSAALRAEPLAGGDLQRNGEVSKRLYIPAATSAVVDRRVSAGLALGVSRPLRPQIGSVAPALTVQLGGQSRLSVLAAPGKGAMLVLQTAAW